MRGRPRVALQWKKEQFKKDSGLIENCDWELQDISDVNKPIHVHSINVADWNYLTLKFNCYSFHVISVSISMSEVDAQGDSCTATIFWSIMFPCLLYSASSSIPLTKYSILHNGISSKSLGSIKNLPKLQNLNSASAFAIFFL
jgi:hypothetical protein